MIVYMLRIVGTDKYWQKGNYWTTIDKGEKWNSKRGPGGARGRINRGVAQYNRSWAVKQGEREPTTVPETEVVKFQLTEIE